MAFTYYAVGSNVTFTCNLGRVTNDPAPGEAKACFLSLDNASLTELPGFLPCASEGEVCGFEGTAVIAFGVSPNVTYKTLANSAYCDPKSFGVDPAFGYVKTCFYKPLAPAQVDPFGGNCASEHGTCGVGAITSMAAYGQGKQWAIKDSRTGDIDCSNALFGDPAQGVDKVCRTVRSSWKVCAKAGETCTLPIGSVAGFGLPGGLDGPSSLTYRTFLNGGSVQCALANFNGATSEPPTSPPNRTNFCFYDVLSLEASPPAGFTYCGKEKPGVEWVCNLGAGRSAQVAFGAYGKFVYLPSKTGDFDCEAASFTTTGQTGVIDPQPNVQKGCYYRLY